MAVRDLEYTTGGSRTHNHALRMLVPYPLGYDGNNSGGIRTREAFAQDLKSCPFDRSGTLPNMLPVGLEPTTFGS